MVASYPLTGHIASGSIHLRLGRHWNPQRAASFDPAPQRDGPADAHVVPQHQTAVLSVQRQLIAAQVAAIRYAAVDGVAGATR